jgi:hypothetical protein
MYSPLSSLWDPVARGTQRLSVRVDAYRGGVLLASDLPVDVDGSSIRADGSAEVRRTLDLVIGDPSLVPTSASDILTPNGTELHVFQGFKYPDDTVERVPTIVARIDKPATAFGGQVKVSAADRSRAVAEDQFITSSQSVAGATVVAEITRLIQSALSTATVTDLTGSATVCPRTSWEPGTSKWAAVQELAVAIDADVAPGPDGTFWIRPQPDITDPPVLTMNIGESGQIVEGEEEWDREGVFNAVIARGERTDGSAPVSGSAYDLDAASPTYWNGSFGHRPKFYSSPLLTTISACNAAAATMLAKSITPARSISVECIPNPALDIGDVVSLIIPGAAGSVDLSRSETHIVHAFTLPIGLGLMSVTFRSSNDPS